MPLYQPPSTGSSGSVATDTIWDAAGDLAVGTGADTAAKLSAGATSGHVLTSNGAAAAPSWQAAAAGGLSHAYGGYNTIGASTEAITGDRIYTKKITLAATSYLAELELYLDESADSVGGLPQLGIWSDNAGVPLSLIYQAQSSVSDQFYIASSSSSWPARWIGVGGFQMKKLAAGDYWIGWMFQDTGAFRLYYDAGADRYFSAGGGNHWLANGDRYAQTDSTRKYSARVSVFS